jgi:hypothetical protein
MIPVKENAKIIVNHRTLTAKPRAKNNALPIVVVVRRRQLQLRLLHLTAAATITAAAVTIRVAVVRPPSVRIQTV